MTDENPPAGDGQQPPPSIFRAQTEAFHAGDGQRTGERQPQHSGTAADESTRAWHTDGVADTASAQPTEAFNVPSTPVNRQNQPHSDYLRQAAQHFQGASQQQSSPQAPPVSAAPAPRVNAAPVPPAPQVNAAPVSSAPPVNAAPVPPAPQVPPPSSAQAETGGAAAGSNTAATIVLATAVLFVLLLVRSAVTSVAAAFLMTMIDAVIVIGYLVFRSQVPQQARELEAGVLGFAGGILGKVAALGRTTGNQPPPAIPNAGIAVPGAPAAPVAPAVPDAPVGQVHPVAPMPLAAPGIPVQAVPGGYTVAAQGAAGYLVDAYGRPVSDKTRTAAGILQISLGSFAAGRFYLGYTGLAIAQIAVVWLTCGLGGIWTLIDGIRILMGKVPDARGLPLRD